MIGTGILMTLLTKFFQLSHIGHWFKNTIGGIFSDRHITEDRKQYCQYSTDLFAAFIGAETVFQIIHGAAAPFIFGIFAAIIDSKYIFGIVCHHAEESNNPHPEDAEKLVPFMAIAYILGALMIFFANIDQCGAVFSAIFKGAFGLKAVGGGIVGSGVKMALTWGMKYSHALEP